MNYKTILFDLDGTLIDPKLGITSGVQYALSLFGINEDRDMLTPFIGPPMQESFQKFYGFDEKKAAEAVKHFREYYVPKGLYESTIYRGIPEMLAKLKKAKRKLYVVTFKPTFQAEKILQYHNIDEYFDGIKGVDPGMIHSDKITLLNELLDLLPDEKPHTMVMVGDRAYDILGAQAHNIDSIGLTFGYGSHEEIKDTNPTHIANSITELEKYLL